VFVLSNTYETRQHSAELLNVVKPIWQMLMMINVKSLRTTFVNIGSREGLTLDAVFTHLLADWRSGVAP
jgi:hypothetical protein